MLRFVIFGYHTATHQCCQYLLNKGARLLHCYPRDKKISLIENKAISYFRFDSISDHELFTTIREFNADYILTIICNEKIPAEIVNLCRNYALNFHPAPLPDCRTANPWFWVIRLGYIQSAITVHLLADKFDSGDIVYKQEFPLGPLDYQWDYELKFLVEIQSAVENVYKLILSGQIEPEPQSGKGRYYDRVRFRDICIDWEKSAGDIHNLIRACNPIHPAITEYKNNMLTIFEAQPTDFSPSRPGELTIDKDRIYCSCRDSALELTVFFFKGVCSARRLIELMDLKSGAIFTPGAQVDYLRGKLDSYV